MKHKEGQVSDELLVDAPDTETIDKETFAIVLKYCGRDPRIPREITEEIVFEEGERNFKGFIADLQAAYADIPKKYQKTAMVHVNNGEYSNALKLSFDRPETPEEVGENVRRALAYAQREKHKEQAVYERLKAKFEKPNQ